MYKLYLFGYRNAQHDDISNSKFVRPQNNQRTFHFRRNAVTVFSWSSIKTQKSAKLSLSSIYPITYSVLPSYLRERKKGLSLLPLIRNTSARALGYTRTHDHVIFLYNQKDPPAALKTGKGSCHDENRKTSKTIQ